MNYITSFSVNELVVRYKTLGLFYLPGSQTGRRHALHAMPALFIYTILKIVVLTLVLLIHAFMDIVITAHALIP
jgi:hypothetical protein